MEIPFEISPCSVNEIASYLDVSLENIVKIVASMTGLSEDIIYLLKDVEVFES